MDFTLDPGIVTAIVAGTAAIITAAFVFLGARLSDVSRRLAGIEDRERRLWVYCRKLIDHIYRGLGPPPPPPDDLDDLFGAET